MNEKYQYINYATCVRVKHAGSYILWNDNMQEMKYAASPSPIRVIELVWQTEGSRFEFQLGP